MEARNEREEIFEFERLIEVIKWARSMSAESLLKEIIDRVNAFAGGTVQHDDLTVIVVSVIAIRTSYYLHFASELSTMHLILDIESFTTYLCEKAKISPLDFLRKSLSLKYGRGRYTGGAKR